MNIRIFQARATFKDEESKYFHIDPQQFYK